MTKVVIVGDMYYSDLGIGGGPIIPGPGGGAPGVPTHPIYNPAYPDQGLPGWQPRPSHPIAPGGGGPVDPGYGVPIGGHPSHPIYNPAYPDQGLPGNQPYPDNSLPGGQPRPDHGLPPFPSHPWIPPQYPTVDPVDPTKAYLVAVVPKSDGSGYERITFTVDLSQLPEAPPPTEPEPK